MGVFENGWICRQCWSANREGDGRCYRCHTDRPNYGSPTVETAKAQPAAPAPKPVVLTAEPAAPAPKPAPEVREVAAATIVCTECSEHLAIGSRFCTRCGSPVAATERSAPAWRRLLKATSAAAASPAPTADAAEESVPAPEPVAVVVPAKPATTPRAERVRGVPLGQRISASVAKRFAWLQAIAPRRLFAPPIEWVRGRVEQLRSVQNRPTLSLFVAWAVLWIASGALLFAYAGGELLIGMLVVLTLCVLSALTAAMTVILVGPRRRMLNDLAEQMRVLSERTSANQTTASAPPRVMQQISSQAVRKAS